jgi:glycosyltransferase involved in cell wall biosynthesis
VVTDEELAAGLRDRGARQAARFSWQKSAEALLRYFESVLQRR